ncbi:MAG: OmpP1/FadL family transporter [Burkholderiales bacterium]
MTRIRALSFLALSSLALPAAAGSFYLPASDSVAALGRGYAGQAALGYDATSVMSNPAAMTQLGGTMQFSLGLNALKTDVRIRDQGTTVLGGAVPGGIPVDGVVEGDASDLAGLPNLAFAHRIGGARNVWLGFGVQAPFGLGIEYNPAFRARYDTREARLRVIDVSGAVGFQLTDNISLGGGINVQRTDARLENAVPNLNGTGPGQFATDGVLIVRADSYAVGGNVGLHIKANDALQLGLHYKSRMSHDLEGYGLGSSLTGVPDVLPLDLLNGRSGAATRLNLPDVITASAAWQATDNLSLMAELRWFNWSRFRELAFQFDLGGGNRFPLNRPESYHDEYGLAFGGEYRLNPQWTVRAGYLYDRTPTPNTTRSVAVPDADRHWFSVGASWAFDRQWILDMAYSRVDFETVRIDRTDALANTVRATGNPSVDVIGLAVRKVF